MENEVRMTLRLPENLRDRLRDHARSERRSLNSELVYMLEASLRAAGVDAESPGGDSATSAPLRGKPDSPPQAGGTPTPA